MKVCDIYPKYHNKLKQSNIHFYCYLMKMDLGLSSQMTSFIVKIAIERYFEKTISKKR